MRDYKLCVQNLATYSKGANIFVLIHKMDKINEVDRKKVFDKKRNEIVEATVAYQMNTKEVFATSIWDDTLYKVTSGTPLTP
jgi:Ras-related GTP-binding protein A/B